MCIWVPFLFPSCSLSRFSYHLFSPHPCLFFLGDFLSFFANHSLMRLTSEISIDFLLDLFAWVPHSVLITSSLHSCFGQGQPSFHLKRVYIFYYNILVLTLFFPINCIFLSPFSFFFNVFFLAHTYLLSKAFPAHPI